MSSWTLALYGIALMCAVAATLATQGGLRWFNLLCAVLLVLMARAEERETWGDRTDHLNEADR